MSNDPSSEQPDEDQDEDETAVAVIGMAGRFPGARDLREFWANLAGGVESVAFLSDEELAAAGVDESVRRAPAYVPASARLDDVDCFDNALFGYSPREAALMDPQCRVCLELAWHALEDAGLGPSEYGGSVGVFATASLNTYLLHNLRGQIDPQDFVLGLGNIPVVIGNAPDFVATRISYKLNLRGPSVAVQTACSSSLTAIHLARQSLLNAECDVALAGGVSIYLPQDRGYLYRDGMILSPDGHCRAFDADADGITFGRGGGMVVLKLLSRARADGDRVRAVIKGSAANNDGARKVGFTAPSVTGQSRVIAEAMADAGVRPDSISYVEAHGTGTRLGDPIEVAALTEAYRKYTKRAGFCALGTVKTNFGHLDVAAGVTGFIKTVLMLEHRQLTPTLHYRRPNPEIDFAASPFYVNAALKPWPDDAGRRRAGVSAFGIGGTNVHVILEEAPAPAARPYAQRAMHVLRVSARSKEALATLCTRLAGDDAFADSADLADACFTANTGRAHLPHRVVARAPDAAAMREALRAAAEGSPDPRVAAGHVQGADATAVAFLFTGLGAQSVGMGRVLYDNQPVFREALDRCDALLRPYLEVPLLRVLYPPAGEASPIETSTYGQPVMFAFEYALAMLYQSWGVRPAAVLGHSLGQYGASCLSGLLPLEDAIRMVATRSRLADTLPPGGGMAAVLATEDRVLAALGPDAAEVAIASVNAPESIVISGRADAIARVAARLTADKVDVRILKVSHGFHSAMLDPILDAFEATAAKTKFGRAQIPIISNLDGQVLRDEEGRDPRYWRRHAREVVRFADGVQTLYERGIRTFVEIGPHTTATGMAAGCISDESAVFMPSLRRDRNDLDQIFETLGELYVRGVAIDWSGLEAGAKRRRVPLPLYPFARDRHWIAPSAAATGAEAPAAGRRLVGRPVRTPLLSGPERAFELGADSAVHRFLADHRVFGAIVFPATGYIEAALEAAEEVTGRRASVVENLEVADALIVAGRPAQVVARPEGDDLRLDIFAATEADEGWRRFGGCRVVATANGAPLGGRLPGAVRGTERSGEDYYEALARLGFEYGPAFRGIAALTIGDGEVTARVRIPDAIVEEAAAYRFHPALLDACLQVVIGLLPADRTFLPVGIERIVLGEPRPELLVHAALRPAAKGARRLQADVRIAAADGEPIAQFVGITLAEVDPRRLAAGRPPEWEKWLYEVAWRPAPLPVSASAPATVAPQPLAEAMRERLDPLRAQHAMADYQALQPALDRACAGYALAAFQSLRWSPSPGQTFATADLCDALSIAPAHQRMAHRLLEMLADDGLLERAGDRWVVKRAPAPTPAPDLGDLRRRYPALEKMFELVDRCGRGLGPGLRDEVAAVDLLFPGGALTDLETLYTKSPFARVYNELVATAAAKLAASLPAGRPLRVLEVGAGTGGTTASILPALPADRTRYTFTDVSRLFLARAEERFAAFPFVEYRLLDAGVDPTTQGFTPGSFDVVVASNVLHATADLGSTLVNMRRLLAPGGLIFLVEGIARQGWVDLLFGLTDGWWKFTDVGTRPDYPLLSQRQWKASLAAAGFGDFVAVPGEERPDALFHQAVMMARSIDGGRWLVVDDAAGTGARLASDLAGAVVVPAGDAVAALAAETGRLDGVVFMCGGDDLTGTRALLDLVKALAAHPTASSARLFIVTRGAQPVVPGDEVPAVFAATAWGLAQVVSLEQPDLRCTCIDLPPGAVDDGLEALRDELAAASPETRVALRGGERHVARLRRAEASASKTQPPKGTAARLESPAPGVLDTLRYAPVPRRSPGPAEVEIRVRATGLNFKDVLTALGRLPGGPLGFECAGEVAAVGAGVSEFAVGDRVIGFAPHALATHVIADARLVARKPDRISFEQAATVAGGFLTAHAALHDLAKIQRGERVLIHAATGGVGLAAVQLAQRAGCEIFATAGSDAKRALLASMGVTHVFSSRTTEFGDAIHRLTGGRGVDVVLNSLTGEVLDRSLAVLAAGGRFVELGRSAGSAAPDRLPAGARYFNPDVASECLADPARGGPVLRALIADVERGALAPLPCRAFDADDTVAAFRLMARAGHIGKVVVRQRDDADGRRLPAELITADGTYLIVGGLGGLGLLVAERLIDHGARHLALMSRRAPGEAEQAAIARLAERARIIVVSGDVSRRDDVERALAEIRAGSPPLRGVIQAAGVLDDGVLAQQTWERFARVFGPKVDGSWHLHQAVAGEPLDFFILFSSVASLLGSAGQANHAAANAFMDALASHRRARGLPGLSINWGAWSALGAAARRNIGARIAARGLGEIAPDDGMAAFDRLLSWPRAQVGAVPVDWQLFRRQLPGGQEPPFFADMAAAAPAAAAPSREPAPAPRVLERVRSASPGERPALIAQFVRDHVVKGLGLNPAAPIDGNQPLSALGLDSLLAVELRNALSRGLGLARPLSATLLFDFPSISALTGHLLETVVGAAPAPAPSPAASRGTDELDIAALTDQEAEALLLQELESP